MEHNNTFKSVIGLIGILTDENPRNKLIWKWMLK